MINRRYPEYLGEMSVYRSDRIEHNTRERGAILLEVLVAFTIMAISITALSRGLSTSAHHHRIATDRLLAASHATSILARIGRDLPLRAPVLRGEIDQRFTWEIVSAAPSRTPLAWQLVQITVTISWPDGSAKRSLTVTTTRLLRDGHMT